ncbi:GNAT family N-acetyltransferase [Clostridium sporogenes]|uniref:GNAT family N-acetyltransferase n=2 Tax=Clostridium sporogenes TaxID=1509 RepID=UPI00223874AF|nr:GNAT family protein [Clostridium sporogenes]MCW6078523.1 GNAT family N-acetyltransferase [Clostridium sporogenes]
MMGERETMKIETNHVIIRDFERKDAENLHRIVREKNIFRFMPDWAENGDSPQSYWGYIDWHQTEKNSTDIYKNKRYAIALPDTDEMIGMVGMGLEDTLNEVEVAYFMSEKYQRKGYTKEAINALVNWCFSVSDIKYLILSIDCANVPSCRLAEKCDFELFEKRTPIGHKQSNMESDSYFYYRKYRNLP